MLNKRAIVGDLLQVATILIVLTFFYFFLISPASGSDVKSKERFEFESIDIDSEQILVDYLRSPFPELQNSNIADAILIYFTDQDETLLEDITLETNEFLSKSDLERSKSSWTLEIDHPIKDDIVIESLQVKSTPQARVFYDLKKEVARTILPVSKQEPIEIKLFFVITRNE